MKTKILLLVFLVVHVSSKTFSQDDNNYKVEIENEDLRKIIKEYNNYLKKWSVDDKIKNYLISLDHANDTAVNKITLNAILYEAGIDSFKPCLYASVDNIPIIIRSKLSVLLKENKILVTSIKKLWWKTDTSYQKIYDKQLLEHNKLKPDSVLIASKNGPKKVSTKTFVPVKVDLEAASVKYIPSKYILTFRGDSLVEKIITVGKRLQ